jgi:hypothetical protein
MIQLHSHDFAGAAQTWRNMADYRLYAFGSKEPSVILGLRETAILAALADDEKQRTAADSLATRFEKASKAQPPDPRFPPRPEDRARVDRDSAIDGIALYTRSVSAKMPPAQLGRVAAMYEAYAESAARSASIANADKKVASAYQTALALRERCCGRDSDPVRATARQLAAWYDAHGHSDDAKKLRDGYALQ